MSARRLVLRSTCKLCSVQSSVTRSSSRGLTAALSTNTTKENKNFISGPATEWKKSLLKPFVRRQFDLERVLLGERRLPEVRFNSLIYWRSENLGPHDSGRSLRGMDIFQF